MWILRMQAVWVATNDYFDKDINWTNVVFLVIVTIHLNKKQSDFKCIFVKFLIQTKAKVNICIKSIPYNNVQD